MSVVRTVPLLVLFLGACSGGEDEVPPVDPVEEGCYLVAEGTPIDAGPTPEEATELALGLDPWRVGLYPDQVSFVSITTTGKPLVLMADAAGVFASLSTNGDEVDLPDAFENPTCGQDVPEVMEVDLPAGTHVLGVGPHYKATIWVIAAERG